MAKLPETDTVPVAKPENSVAAPLRVIEKKLDGVTKTIERICKQFGVSMDIDGDGKIGAARIGALISLAVAMCVLAAVSYGVEEIVLKNTAPQGYDAVIEMESDGGDDTNDELQIGMKASDNSMYISIGGTELVTLSAAGALAATSITADSTNYSGGVTADTEITLTDSDGAATISAVGFDDSDAVLILDADNGDDNADTWTIESEATGNDLSIMNHATEVLNLTSGGNLQVDGTFIAGGAADVASITVDAGAGIDSQSAGTLLVGAATATKVEVSLSTIETEIQGTLDVLEASDFNEEITIDLDAADEEIIITQSHTAHTEGVPLIMISDSATGATATEADEATMEISSAGVYALVLSDGALYVEGTSELVGDATLTGDATINGNDLTLGATGVKMTSDADGAITFLGLSTGNDEDLTLNLDDVADEATVSSSTGVTLLDLDGNIDLEISGNDLTIGEAGVKITSDGDGAITLLGLGDGSDEDLKINLDDTANTAVITSSTGLDLITLTSIGLTVGADLIVSGNDIDGAAAALTLGATTATSVDIGSVAAATDVDIISDGGTLSVGKTTAAAVMTALTTATAIFRGADAADAADTLFDTTGAGAITVGSEDVTSVTLDGDVVTTTGPFAPKSWGLVADSSASRTCTDADYGKVISYTQAGAFTVTLPANGAPAGTWIDFVQGTIQNDTTALTVQSTPADTLITANSIDSDSVTFATGHRIGSYLRVISDGAYWQAVNLGQTTMSVTDTD